MLGRSFCRIFRNELQRSLIQKRFLTTENQKPSPDSQKDGSEETPKQQEPASEEPVVLSPEQMSEKLSVFEKDLAASKEECKNLKNNLAYALADIDNVRKISRKDVSNAREFALKNFGKDLLDVADILERALSILNSSKSKSAENASIFEGINMTANMMIKVMDKHGISKMEIIEKETHFDPNFHNALFQQPVSKGMKSGIVFSVLKSGYLLHNRVLRAAEVGVTINPEEEEEEHKTEEEGEKKEEEVAGEGESAKKSSNEEPKDSK